MNQRPFIRKIIHLAILVVLLIPLSLLSMPVRRGAKRARQRRRQIGPVAG